jgi:hypothetical protein
MSFSQFIERVFLFVLASCAAAFVTKRLSDGKQMLQRSFSADAVIGGAQCTHKIT